jgi:polyhydroxyalkanoate synthesis regulator protein
MGQTLGGILPFNPIEEMNKQNVALFENAIKMFVPFFNLPGATTAATQAPREQSSEDTLQALQEQLAALQQRISELTRKK